MLSPLTPDGLVAAVKSGLANLGPPPPLAFELYESAPLQVEAERATAAGDHHTAARAYMDLLEIGPAEHEGYMPQLIEHLKQIYPMGTQSRTLRNHTATFFGSMAERVDEGAAVVLSREPPVYLLRDLLSAEEVAEVRALGQRRRDTWSRHHPLVCFQHDSYTGHAGLAGQWWRLAGRPGGGARGCLTQEASRAVAGALPASESLFVYRGEEEALERLARRVEAKAGLHRDHAHPFQLLRYRKGESYADHADCDAAAPLEQPENRMATLLIYLTSDFDGGETEFPRLGLTVKPSPGSALLFHSYGQGGRCNPDSTHRSNAVERGGKEVLQLWYSYAEQPFLSARTFRTSGDGMLPFQPMTVCDYTAAAQGNVSCRWYNSHNVMPAYVLRDGRRA